MAQQTAVEWLIEKIHKNMGVWIPPHIQDQAKALEKEQIVNTYKHGQNNGYMYKDVGNDIIDAEQYYNQTYGGKDL